MRTTRKQLLCTGAFAALTLGATGCIDATVGEVDVCTYEGKGYSAGERFAASDGCNTCSCAITGEVSCTEIGCVDGGGQNGRDGGAGQCVGPDGRTYKLGETFKDDCNTCSCTAEGPACTLIGCNPGGCNVNGVHYLPGQSVGSSCGACICQADGSLACPDIACPDSCMYGGKLYMPGQSFPSTDGCNSCSCGAGGSVACTAKACGPTCSVGGRTYQAGESFQVDCNACTCDMTGALFCTAAACGCSLSENGDWLAEGQSVLAEDGCNTYLCANGDLSSTDAACGPVPKIEKCGNNANSSLEQVQVRYRKGDVLVVEASFPGCANEGKSFKLCYDGVFLESNPVQTALYVVPSTTATCSSMPTGQRAFDLSPLKQAYLDSYQSVTGTIQLQVEKTMGVTYKF